MNCHGDGSHNGGRKRTWTIVLLVAVLATGLWVAFGSRGLIGLLPFTGILLCPIIHGAMLFFMGKNMMHGSGHQHTSMPQIESEPKQLN